MADFKKLHDDWKKAKKDAKLMYDGWARFFTDVIAVLDTGKIDLESFPTFSKGLGPSLDNIQKALDNIKKTEAKKKPADKKDTDAVAKNKGKALAALKQYKEDIAKLAKYVASKAVPGEDEKKPSDKLVQAIKKGNLIKNALVKELGELDAVRKKIKTALDELT